MIDQDRNSQLQKNSIHKVGKSIANFELSEYSKKVNWNFIIRLIRKFNEFVYIRASLS